MRMRRTHTPEFKARVAMSDIIARTTIYVIAADHAIHPIQLSGVPPILWQASAVH